MLVVLLELKRCDVHNLQTKDKPAFSVFPAPGRAGFRHIFRFPDSARGPTAPTRCVEAVPVKHVLMVLTSWSLPSTGTVDM